MTFESIVHSIPEWLTAEGPEKEIVISSRARLARNVRGVRFAHRANDDALGEIVETVVGSAPKAGFSDSIFFQNETLTENQRQVFIERHLISNALAAKTLHRGVLVGEGENRSILVNEEDHLRIQSFQSGFNPQAALESVSEIDDRLSKAIEFSFSSEYGYLTACPTNMGTGLRVSVLIHLPALVFTGEIQRVIRSAGQLGLNVRGYFGEGSEVVGNIFQISNQRSLGLNERSIVESLREVVVKIIDYEKQAAATLMKESKQVAEDKVWRSLGMLKTARLLSTREFMNMGSAIRFGILMNLIDPSYLPVLNTLMVTLQPAHLQEQNGDGTDAGSRDARRADIVRAQFINLEL